MPTCQDCDYAKELTDNEIKRWKTNVPSDYRACTVNHPQEWDGDQHVYPINHKDSEPCGEFEIEQS
jgi:hypothetical protein